MSEGTKKQAETPKQGTFCWDELATTDMEASKMFYSEIFGWHLKSSDNADIPMEYSEFGTDENHPVGGIYGDETGNVWWDDSNAALVQLYNC